MAEEFKRYQIPTHLRTEDQLTIGWFSFTFRQVTLLVLGIGGAFECGTQLPWGHLAALVGKLLALLAQGMLLGVIVALTLALAFVRWRGRTLDTWAFVWLRYRLVPRCYRWQPLPDAALRHTVTAVSASQVAPEEE